jgi:toxin ParE1/3/4
VKLVVSQAAADLVRLRAFLLERNAQAAQRAAAVIVRAIDSLDVFPERGRPAPVAGMRELVVPFGGSSYVIRFAIDAIRVEVVVLRIWHGRKDRP